MSMLPARVLFATMDSVTPTENWTVDDGSGDPWIGYPYRWEATFTVGSQPHGSHLTPTPFYYDGLDVKVGDWFADIGSGSSVKIISITSQTSSTLTVVVEDVDRFNIFSDPTSAGNAIGSGAGYIFELADSGLPILGPMTAVNSYLSQNPAWQLDQISRFNYRNYVSNNYRVYQPGHTFAVGDIVYINGSSYSKATANSDIMRIVGQVNSIGTPGPDWFTYRPTGRVVDGLNPPLPGSAGSLIYLSNTGVFTTTKPTRYARPFFIQLEVNTRGLYIDRNVEAVDETIGYTSQIYIVNTTTERDTLTVNPGDQAFVINMGNGEWAHFIYEMSNTWVQISTEDSARTDAETYEVTILGSTVGNTSATIATISDSRTVTGVTVKVLSAFDGNPVLTVGTASNANVCMSADNVDLTVVGTYEASPSFLNNTGNDVDIQYFLEPNGSTTGNALISVTYL